MEITKNYDRILTAFLLLATSYSYAGAMDIFTFFSDSIKYRISVVDERDQPIPHATLWLMYAYGTSPERNVNDMRRLVARYALDNDIIAADITGPISGIQIFYTDSHGIFRDELQENDFRGLTELPVFVGVIKRGYRPVIYSKVMPVGSSHEMVLQLQKDNSRQPDPRLLELDEIRSKASSVFPNWTGEERTAYVQKMNNRLRGLAKEFEQEGMRDEAAIAYYNLAYLPSLLHVVATDGKVQVAGYTRSYDEKSPERKADLFKAFSFDSSIPQLRCRELIEIFDDQGGLIWADLSKTALRERFITNIEACVRVANERFFPNVLHLLSRTYSSVGNHKMACDTMKRAYRFEPRYVSAKEWPNHFYSVSSLAKNPPKGIQALDNFSCEMPRD